MLDSSLRPDERAGLRLRELYQNHGYLPYRMSKFEPYDLYVRNKSFLVSENILTFTDTDGRLMALKPDVTLSIVKNVQPSPGPLEKICYSENVYRTTAAGLGFREIMQTGLECIGNLDLAAMGEVLALAAESLALLDRGYLLDLGHMGLVSGLLEQVADESARRRLMSELGRKNAPELDLLCAQAGMCQEFTMRIKRLSQLYGPPAQVLPELEKLAAGAQERAALDELKGLCRMMEGLGLLDHLRLDFSIANDMRYYNGVIFRGYLPGLSSGVLAGGRYDNLLRRMGKTGGAIGFAVYLDQLDRLESGREYDVDVLLLYRPQDDPSKLAAYAEKLRREGRSVRMERSEPQGLRWRELVRFQEGGES